MSNFYLITYIGPWPRPTPGRGGGVLPALPVMRLLQLVGGCHWVAVLRRGHWRRSGRPGQRRVFRLCGVATHAAPICARSIIAGDIYVNVVKKAAEPLRRSARWPTQARVGHSCTAPTLFTLLIYTNLISHTCARKRFRQLSSEECTSVIPRLKCGGQVCYTRLHMNSIFPHP